MPRNKFFQATCRFFFLIAIVLISLVALFYILPYIYPFIIAFMVTYFTNPFVHFLQKKLKFPRTLAIITVLTTFFATVGAIIALLVLEIIQGIQFLMKVLPHYFQKFIQLGETFLLEKVFPLYENILDHLDKNNQETIIHYIRQIGNSITTILTDGLVAISSHITLLPTTITTIIVSLLATFFISKDWGKMVAWKEEIVPKKISRLWHDVFSQLTHAFIGLLKAQLTLAIMTLLIVLIGLIILRIPHPFTISLIIGIADLIPFGTGFVFLSWIGYSLMIGKSQFALLLFILYVLVLVQRQIMEPKIISSHMGIHPLPTLIALFICYQLFGLVGFILAPIIVVLIQSLKRAKVFHYAWQFIIG